MMFRATQLAGLYLSVAQAAAGTNDGTCSLTCTTYASKDDCDADTIASTIYDVKDIPLINNPTSWDGDDSEKPGSEGAKGKGYPAIVACGPLAEKYDGTDKGSQDTNG